MDIKNANFKQFDNQQLINYQKSNLDLIKDVKTHITLKMGETDLTIEELQNLKIGSIFGFNKDISNLTIDIMIDEQKIGTGEVVIVNGEAFIKVVSIGKK